MVKEGHSPHDDLCLAMALATAQLNKDQMVKEIAQRPPRLHMHHQQQHQLHSSPLRRAAW
jgi:hypothetical protein